MRGQVTHSQALNLDRFATQIESLNRYFLELFVWGFAK